jgi:hypothetical protein
VIAEALSITGAELAGVVSEREYLRLLQLPRSRPLEGDLRERAEGARGFYAAHGRPFAAARRAGLRDLGSATVALETGDVFESQPLADRLRAGEAHALLALCASAGLEVAEEAARLWAADRPDEAYFLDRFAAAAAERLVFWAAGSLCRASEPKGETLLPHLSPGCGHWDIADQHRLMRLLTGPPGPGPAAPSPRNAEPEGAPGAVLALGPVSLLPSGALRPPHSVLAAFGVTRRASVRAPEDLCRACDLHPCAYRRTPYAVPDPVPQETR